MSFNEYFETIKDIAVEGAQTAVKKTKQFATIAKAHMAIRGEEEKIKKAQIELGKLYYKDYIVGEAPDAAEYNPWCEKISEAKIAIEDMKIAIEDLRASGVNDEEDFVVEVTEDDLVQEEAPCCCDTAEACCSEESADCDCGEEAPEPCDCSKETAE